MNERVVPIRHGHPHGPAWSVRSPGRRPDQIDSGRILQPGDHLFHAGDSISAPCLVVGGVLKSYVSDEDGDDQVIGLHMTGDIVGFEALVHGRASCAIVALDTAKVRKVNSRSAFGGQTEALSDSDMILMGMYREMLRLTHLLKMNRGPTEGRLARFLLDYGELQVQRGCSREEFLLPMGRRDLARYLGLATETLSRLFGRFRDRQLLEVVNNHIRILDLDGLARLAGTTCRDPVNSA